MSTRLYGAACNFDTFNTDTTQATFPKLIKFAAYLERPAAYDACINKLRQIDGAKQEWAMKTGAPTNATPTWNDLKPYLGCAPGAAVLPQCPHGGIYRIGDLQSAPTCTVKGHALN